MRIGLLGPSSTRELADLLEDDVGGLPEGMGGYPVTLLARNLVNRGHEVHLFTLDMGITQPVSAAGEGLRITWVPHRPGRVGRDAYRFERQGLREAAADAPVDVLNPHWSYEYAQAVLHRPEPMVLSVHDWAPTVLRYQPDPYRLVRLGMFIRTHLTRPPMTTPSPYLAAYLRRFRMGHVDVVPNGVPTERFLRQPRTRGRGRHLIGIANGFGHRKNTRSLIRAHGRLRRAGVDTTLTLVGIDHGPGDAAQQFARAEGIDEAITYVGEVPYGTVMDLLSGADVFVHPAREESFGMVLIEAMARGTPVVGGRASGAVPWVLDEGRAGVLVDVDDPAAIALAVQQLLDDQAEWERRSAAGLAIARRRFGMDVVTSSYLDTYDRVRQGR